MTTIKKLLVAGALIVGLQSATFGYNPTICNNQITAIEIAIKELKHYCDEKAVEATRYLKEAVQNTYLTSDNTIIELATVVNSEKSLNEKINCILNIKIKNVKEQQENAMLWNERETILDTVLLTLLATLTAYVVYSEINNAIVCTIANHKNDLITTAIDQIKSSCNGGSLLNCIKSKLSS